MPADHVPDWVPVITLDGQTIGTELAAAGAADVVAVDSLTFTYGREELFSASDGDTLAVTLLVRNPAWLESLGMPGGRLVTMKLLPEPPITNPYFNKWPMFVGRVVPESITLTPADRAGDAWLVELTAIDLRAWSAGLVVGQPPWPSETLNLRLGRLNTLARASAGLGISQLLPTSLNAFTVAALDVDRRPLADMLDDLASGLGLCWVWDNYSRPAELPPVLKLGLLAATDPVAPASWDPGGYWDPANPNIADARHAVLPGRFMSATDDSAHQSVGAVNEVRVNYVHSTAGAITYVASDLASQNLNGLRSMTVESPVRLTAEAKEIGDRLLLIATRLARWRHPPVTWSYGPPAARSTIDQTARQAVLLASELYADAPAGELPSVYVAGSVYNDMPTPPMAGEGVPMPWWQVIGGRVEYARGELAGTINLAPRFTATAPDPVTWEQLTSAVTWNTYKNSLVNSSITWRDLTYFPTKS